MKKALLGVLACSLIGCATMQTNSSDGKKKKVLDETDNAKIAEIEELGRQLFKKDYFGAIATDLLLDNIDPKDYPNFGGWIVEVEPDKVTVHFYLMDDDKVSVLADIEYVPEQAPKYLLKPERIVDAAELAMFKARQTGLMAGANKCSDRFNTVVIPSADGKLQVYVLAATTDPDAIVVGGHSKVTVSKDGTKVLSIEAYSTSCIALDKTPEGMPEGAKVTGLFVTHVVSPYPAPTHVFQSLLHQTGLFVVTDLGIWSVDKGNVSFVEGN